MFYDHNLQPVLEPDKVKLLWDFTIQTEKRLQNRYQKRKEEYERKDGKSRKRNICC